MSIRWVGMDVMDTTVTLVGPGEEIGDDEVPAGKLAVVLGTGSDAVAIIGTPQQLRDQIAYGLTLPVPDGVELVDGL